MFSKICIATHFHFDIRTVCEINACPMVRFYLISLRAILIGIKTDRAVDPNFGLAVCKIRFNEKKKA
jgi:hypothetical protein